MNRLKTIKIVNELGLNNKELNRSGRRVMLAFLTGHSNMINGMDLAPPPKSVSQFEISAYWLGTNSTQLISEREIMDLPDDELRLLETYVFNTILPGGVDNFFDVREIFVEWDYYWVLRNGDTEWGMCVVQKIGDRFFFENFGGVQIWCDEKDIKYEKVARPIN